MVNPWWVVLSVFSVAWLLVDVLFYRWTYQVLTQEAVEARKEMDAALLVGSVTTAIYAVAASVLAAIVLHNLPSTHAVFYPYDNPRYSVYSGGWGYHQPLSSVLSDRWVSVSWWLKLIIMIPNNLLPLLRWGCYPLPQHPNLLPPTPVFGC